MLSGIGQGNNLAFLSSSAARPAMGGGFTMDVTGNDTPWERATAAMTHVLSRIATLDVRLLGCIFTNESCYAVKVSAYAAAASRDRQCAEMPVRSSRSDGKVLGTLRSTPSI